jgi:carbonic anhydrase
MSHKCAGAILTCEDFRLHQRNDGRNYIAEFIKSLGIDADIITRAGGVQDIIRPKEDGYLFSIIRDLGVSVNLHEAKTIYLINHEDCGAYGALSFANRQEEIAKHYEDLLAAKNIIAREFPNENIKLCFAQLKNGASDEFLIKEI